MNDFSTIDWRKGDGLVPAIVQDADTARVLMLGYMNRDALEQTMRTGQVTFFSRSKQRLWVKGETSGHVLALDSAQVDCDGDTLLILARPHGPVCHNGTETCFGESRPDIGFLGTLQSVIQANAAKQAKDSYVSGLLAKGIYKVAQKVGEEGVETALAAVSGIEEDLKNEAADLIFHLLVLLQAKNLSLADITAVLEQRRAKSIRENN